MSTTYATTNNIAKIFEALARAQAPERFTLGFLSDLGFKGSNDRSIIRVLKAMGFLDSNGVPTQRYFNFLDEDQRGAMVADGMREAYPDLFRVNREAYELDRSKVRNKLKTISKGSLSDQVLKQAAATFEQLSAIADFDLDSQNSDAASPAESPKGSEPATPHPGEHVRSNSGEGLDVPQPLGGSSEISRSYLTYRIEINLPASRDKTVYDVLFRSLKEHLLQ